MMLGIPADQYQSDDEASPSAVAAAAAIRAQLDNPATNPPLSNSWGYYVVFLEGC